nr:helix-turn-helix domain-containing protein [Deltaproteobacteria bacterium]
MVRAISSGVPYLDKIMGGFFLGDNVVWILEPGTYFDVFLEAFLTENQSQSFKIIYVNFDFPPQKILSRCENVFEPSNFILIDAFTHGKGNGDEYFRSFYENPSFNAQGFRIYCIKNMDSPIEYIEIMRDLQQEFKEGSQCKYFFGSLTGMQELWGERDALHFFTYTCPKLFELKSLAYWPLVREAHSKGFLAMIGYITQNVISLSFDEKNDCILQFLKLEGRDSLLLNVRHYYTVQGKNIEFSGDRENEGGEVQESRFRVRADRPEYSLTSTESRGPIRIGGRIREFRLEQNISQVELARALNITPSALSQIENNQSLPSLPLFVELARRLGKSLDSFFVPVPALKKTPRGGM